MLERPLRRQGVAFLGGLVPALALAAVVVLAAALLPGARTQGGDVDLLASAPKSLDDLEPLPDPSGGNPPRPAPADGPNATPSELPPADDSPRLVRSTEPSGPASVLTRPGRLPGPTRLMVLGDSVPYLMGQALALDQDEFGLVVANRSLPACSAVAPDAERVGANLLHRPSDCTGRWVGDAEAFDPDVVIVSLNGDVGLEVLLAGEWGTTCSGAYARRLELRLTERLTAFTARGGQVFLFTPLLNHLPAFRPDGAGEDRDCLSVIERDVADHLDGVALVEFGEWVCPDTKERCRSSLGGVSVDRADGIHFTGADALHVWRLTLPDVFQAAGVS
jgi:hypothetical protein